MIFQILVWFEQLVAKASTVSYGARKATQNKPNMENCLPTKRQTTEEVVFHCPKSNQKS